MGKSDKGMLFFYDWKEPFSELSSDDCKALLMAMLDYSQNGTPPPEFGGGAKIAATFLFPALERSRMRAEVGKLGGENSASKRNAVFASSKSQANAGFASSKSQPQDKTKTINKDDIQDNIQDETVDSLDTLRSFNKNLFLSDRQVEDLLKQMDISDFDYYTDKLSEYIQKTGYHINSHYDTILKWYKEDHKT